MILSLLKLHRCQREEVPVVWDHCDAMLDHTILSVHLEVTRLRRIDWYKSNPLEIDQPALQIHIFDSLRRTNCSLKVS